MNFGYAMTNKKKVVKNKNHTKTQH